MKKFVVIAATGLLAFATAACGADSYHMESVPVDPNYVGVCVNDKGERVADSFCQSAPAYSNGYVGGGVSDFVWGYFLASALMPRYGAPVGSTVIYRVDDTRNNVYRGGVPSTGGKVNFSTFKPMASKVAKPDVAVNSKKYKDVYINQDSTYKKKNVDSNVYKAPANKAPAYKAPAPAPRPAPRR